MKHVLTSSTSFFLETTTEESYIFPKNYSFVIATAFNANFHDPNLSSFWELVQTAELKQGLGWSIVLIIAYLLDLVIGIIGNALVILVFLCKPKMRTVTNTFLVNLAVADLFVILFCVPVTLVANLFKPWILGSFMCKWVPYIQGVAVFASAYSLAALSLDRCIAIFRPMKLGRHTSGFRASVVIPIIWIISLIIHIPWPIVFEVNRSEVDDHFYCVEVWNNEILGKAYFLIANLTCCFLLPLMIIGSSNASVWCSVSRRDIPQDSAAIKRLHGRTRRGVKKTLSILTAAFLTCWILLYIIATRVKLTPEGSIRDWERSAFAFLLPFAQWLGSFNSCLNPILYAFTNSKFRKGCKSIMNPVIPNRGSCENLRINQQVWKVEIPQIPLCERNHVEIRLGKRKSKCSSTTSTFL